MNLTALLMLTLLGSNATGKTLVRQKQGTVVPAPRAKRINYAPNPLSACKAGNTADANWVLTGATCANNTAQAPDGSVSMDTITTSGATGSAYTSSTVPSSPGPFTASAYIRAVSGTAIESIGGACASGFASVVACTRSDGGACATGVSGINAWAYATLGTDVIRMSVTWTCDAAVTLIYGFYHDGRHAVSSGVGGIFWGLKLELGPSPTSL